MSLVADYDSDSSSAESDSGLPNDSILQKRSSLKPSLIGIDSEDLPSPKKQKITIQVPISNKLKMEYLNSKATKNLSRSPTEHETIQQNNNQGLSGMLESLLPKPKNQPKSSTPLPFKPRTFNKKSQPTTKSLSNSSILNHKNQNPPQQNPLEHDNIDNDSNSKLKSIGYLFPLDPESISVKNHSDEEDSYNDIQNIHQYQNIIAEPEDEQVTYSYEQPLQYDEQVNQDEGGVGEEVYKHLSKSERNKLKSIPVKQIHQNNIIDINKPVIKSEYSEIIANSSFLEIKDEPSKLQKRKHNIMYLAFEAKQRETQLKEMYAANNKTKSESRSKYGK
ncbi:hypothetical protein BB559_001708 [Furculomyces boomerangus]|uniref:Uncharacterized protein n=2 Tax=Harpellales TaxID=61421 RepID=A0A2T9YCW4_9FUNG|nr:hypothetical protein BB559_004741 [Furculomyces boomerangus]PVU98290.1 hypothetical protein BB559_001708 [Furculomyces boomerangus]PVZ99238.1 hypothetical protein BB558_004730 [Smittium angustum]